MTEPDPPHDLAGFWEHGPLPAPAAGPPAGELPAGLDRLGRPEITVDGRNLADVLGPAYRALRGAS